MLRAERLAAALAPRLLLRKTMTGVGCSVPEPEPVGSRWARRGRARHSEIKELN